MITQDRNICIWCAIKEGATQTSMAVKYNMSRPGISLLYNKMENELNVIVEDEETEGFV